MILGTISAFIHGSAFPLMIIVFGQMIDIFVQSGNFGEVAKYLSSEGILANLSSTYNISLTYEGIIEDPSLLTLVFFLFSCLSEIRIDCCCLIHLVLRIFNVTKPNLFNLKAHCYCDIKIFTRSLQTSQYE